MADIDPPLVVTSNTRVVTTAGAVIGAVLLLTKVILEAGAWLEHQRQVNSDVIQLKVDVNGLGTKLNDMSVDIGIIKTSVVKEDKKEKEGRK